MRDIADKEIADFTKETESIAGDGKTILDKDIYKDLEANGGYKNQEVNDGYKESEDYYINRGDFVERKTMAERWHEDDKTYLMMLIKERIFPATIGGIIGDALGVPVEFEKRNLDIKDMIGYGTHNQPPGTWSDDSSLTMCLIENIIEKKNEEGLMEKFKCYQENGYWTPYGEMFDIGRTTYEAIYRFKTGVLAKKCGGDSEYDNGNGALMRVSPLVFILWNEPDFSTRVKEIESVTEITHKHPRSTLGCIIYIQFLIYLFCNNKPLKAYEKTIKICQEELTKNEKYSCELKYYKRLFDKTILDVDKEEILSDGYVVSSLEAAIWCFMKTQNFSEAVLQAVNLGGDTDTIASITGTFAGIYYKMKGIPENWINKLVQKEKIINTCQKFYEFCASKEVKKQYGE